MATIDYTIKPSLESDNIDSVINPTASYDSTNIDSGFLIIPATQAISVTGGGRVQTLYYDVLVNVIGDKHTVKDLITVNLRILNKGHFPDRDGVLLSYLEDPNVNRFREKRQVFELIPPTCEVGTYNIFTEMCKYNNGTEYNATFFEMERLLTLPINSTLGEWKFKVEYETDIQPKIIAFDSFEVYTPMKNLGLIIILLLFMIFNYRRHKTNNERRELGKWK